MMMEDEYQRGYEEGKRESEVEIAYLKGKIEGYKVALKIFKDLEVEDAE